MDTLDSRDFKACIFAAPAQVGKPLHIETKVPTPDGWKRLADVHVGDTVFAADGTPTAVIAETETFTGRPCYRITFDDGSSIVADEAHRWAVNDTWGSDPYALRVKTTGEMRDKFRIPTKRGHRFRYSIPVAKPLALPAADLPIPPYILGVWLGDGRSAAGDITTNPQDSQHLAARMSALGVEVAVYEGAAGANGRADRLQVYGLAPMLRGANVLGDKHIPQAYLRASIEQRRELLRGLFDTDGCVLNTGVCEFSASNLSLAEQVYELLVSLGYKPRVTASVPSYQYEGRPHAGKPAVKIQVVIDDPTECFSLPRQIEKLRAIRQTKVRRPTHTGRRFITDIEPVESVPVRCIGVADDSHLFLVGEQMVPTHNTDVILNWLLHIMVCAPSDFILYQTSQSVARDFSRRRLDRLHRFSPAIGEKLRKSGDADNTYDKFYTTGAIATLSWPTINELSGRPVGKVALTDYDRMPQDIDGEGSPFSLAATRTKTFGSFAMTFAESSPGFETTNPKWLPASKHEAPPCPGILSLYNQGDRRRWYWQCPDCKDWFEPAFKLLSWDPDKDIQKAAASVHMRCPHCAVALPPALQADLNRGGRWLKEGQSIDKHGRVHGEGRRSDTASFWLKGPAAAFSTWQTLVTKYLQAEAEFESTGSQEALKSTVNTDQGEPYIPRGIGSSRLPEDIKQKSQPLPERMVPEDVRCLLATIDVQANRFEVQVHGVRPGLDLVVIDRFAIQKSKRLDPDGERYWVKPGTHLEDWELITEQVLMRTYPLADGSGRRMQVKMVGCDSGGKAGVTSKAYDYYRTLRKQGLHGRFMLLKGASMASAPRITVSYPDAQRKDRKAAARGEIPVLLINTDKVKDQLDNMLDRAEPGGGMLVLPEWLPDSFFVELTVEQKDHKGKWVNLKKLRNEAWDLLVYCLALSSYLNMESINWQKPPGWVAEWDANTLVSGETAERRFAAAPKPSVDLGKLAADLA